MGGDEAGPGLATITRRRGKDLAAAVGGGGGGGGRYSLHGVLLQDQEDEHLLQCNIYDATPDHSILKHGLAKSLSNFHLGKF